MVLDTIFTSEWRGDIIMMRRGITEEEDVMNEELRREFGHVKDGQDRIESHLDTQDRQLSDHFKKFNQHVLDDQQIQNKIANHLNEHREEKRHRWMIYSGVFIAAISTLGILVVEIIKHFWMRG
jgi:hypothetical protein